MNAWACTLAALVLVGCASRPRTPARSAEDAAAAERQASTARADALAAAGCYRPMAEALDLYEVALGSPSDDIALRRRAFDVAVQLALRERRLGLYPGHGDEAARRLAVGLDGADVDAALEVVGLVPWRHGTRPPGTPTRQSFTELRARVVRLHGMLLARANDDPLAAVLLMHLLTAYPIAALPMDAPLSGHRVEPPSVDAWPWIAPHLQRPAVALAWDDVRGTTSADDWTVFHVEHPRCDEALVFLADAEFAQRRLASADAALGSAIAALPDLVPARVMRGEIRSELGDYGEALDQFAAVTARVPEHREAWLGTLVALSRLGRHDEAHAAADRLLALGQWFQGEAHYWKAWNFLQQRRLADASASLTEARRLLHSAEVFFLAGLIAYHGEAWPTAREELGRAIELEPGHCDALFTLGAVHLFEQRWPSADASFRSADDCFQQREPALVAAVAEAERSAFDEVRRAALRARRQLAVDACRQQQHWSRYNRAVALANQGQRDEARSIAEAIIEQGGPPGAAASDLLLQLESAGSPPDA